MGDSPYKLSKKPKGYCWDISTNLREPIPDICLTRKSLVSSPILFMQFPNISKKNWGHFSYPLIFSATLTQETEYLDQNSFSSSFWKSLSVCHKRVGTFLSYMSSTVAGRNRLFNYFSWRAKRYSGLVQHLMLCAIWYHLHNLKNVKNTHETVFLLTKLQSLRVSLLHDFLHVF